MEEERKSKFSSGLNIITRLDLLWRRCHELKRKGKYLDWNEELDTIWLELARDIKSGDYEEKETEFHKFEESLEKALPFMDSGTGFSKITPEIIKKRNRQYKILMEKQLFLARLENELDKGTTYEEEEEDF